MRNGGDFAARFPLLFHVADRLALPGIRRHGLLSAAALCDLHGVAEADRPALLSANRAGFRVVGPEATLRRQGMSDRALSTRLVPGLSPADWRALINRKVFLFATAEAAWRLRRVEAGRDQVVLRYATAFLLAAGLDLRACRYNNGYVDRSRPEGRRLRGPEDYVPAARWNGDVPREVTVQCSIPAGVTFTVLADPA